MHRVALAAWAVLRWLLVFRPVSDALINRAVRRPGLRIRRDGQPYRYQWWLINERAARRWPRVYVQYIRRPNPGAHRHDFSWGDRHAVLAGWLQQDHDDGYTSTFVAGDALPLPNPPTRAAPGGVWSISLILPHGSRQVP